MRLAFCFALVLLAAPAAHAQLAVRSAFPLDEVDTTHLFLIGAAAMDADPQAELVFVEAAGNRAEQVLIIDSQTGVREWDSRALGIERMTVAGWVGTSAGSHRPRRYAEPEAYPMVFGTFTAPFVDTDGDGLVELVLYADGQVLLVGLDGAPEAAVSASEPPLPAPLDRP